MRNAAVLTALVLVHAPPAALGQVHLTFETPQELSGDEARDCEQLTDLLRQGVAEKFEMVDDADGASDMLTMQITGPLAGCFWTINCLRSGLDYDVPLPCWETSAMVKFCREADVEDINQIPCLMSYIDLDNETPQALPQRFCEPQGGVVYLCLDVIVEDDPLKSSVVNEVEVKLPKVIPELQPVFSALGYELELRHCADEAADLQGGSVTIAGWVDLDDQGRIAVTFTVTPRDLEELARVSEPGCDVYREECSKLHAKIVNFLKERLSNGD